MPWWALRAGGPVASDPRGDRARPPSDPRGVKYCRRAGGGSDPGRLGGLRVALSRRATPPPPSPPSSSPSLAPLICAPGWSNVVASGTATVFDQSPPAGQIILSPPLVVGGPPPIRTRARTHTHTHTHTHTGGCRASPGRSGRAARWRCVCVCVCVCVCACVRACVRA